VTGSPYGSGVVTDAREPGPDANIAAATRTAWLPVVKQERPSLSDPQLRTFARSGTSARVGVTRGPLAAEEPTGQPAEVGGSAFSRTQATGWRMHRLRKCWVEEGNRMRQVPGYPLWLGHVGDVRDLRTILSTGILALVDLALNEPTTTVTRELVYCRFPLLEGSGNPPWLLRTAIDTLAGLLRSGTPTVLFCGAGMSRTPIIAAAAVAQVRHCSLAEAVDVVMQSGPADLSPGLLAEVQALSASSSARSKCPSDTG
jgi:hypothetical protein